MEKEEKINVTKSSLPKYEDYCKKIKLIWENHWLSNNGVLHNELEIEIKKYLNVNNITLFTNGHLALENLIQSLNLKGEVITTPFTFVSTTHAILRNGLTPVFCDINPEDFTIDVNKIEELITDKTCAIVPVHVYGNICNNDRIMKIARKYNLKVIYDAAHAFGVKKDGIDISNYGDASMYSFHATKVFNTIEGGAVVYKNNDLKDKLESLKNFGITNEDSIDLLGGNSKMNEFQSAMGLCNLEYINNWIIQRKEKYELYRKLLKDIPGIQLNKIQEGVKSNYAYFPIVINNEYGITRDELCKIMNENNIYPRKYFYPLTNQVNSVCNNVKIINNTPIAKNISKRVLTLPLYPELKNEEVEKICEIIKNNYRSDKI